jgi:hypothetical protein
MDSIKQRLLTNWHLMRIIRLAIGVWLLVVGIQTHDWPVGLFSIFFLYQAVTDTGCCGTQGCYTSASKPAAKREGTEDIEYEEVK